jgi:hypothetical protein
MKYLDKSFSTPANSRAYVEGWERVFGEEKKAEPEGGYPDTHAGQPIVTTDEVAAVTIHPST